MTRLIQACLRYPALTAVVTVLLVAVGLHALMFMPRTEDPSITIRTGLVLAAYPGASSAQVEQQVTRTLESAIFKFEEVRKDRTFATSRPGVVIVNVELEKGVRHPDLFWAKLRHELNVVKATALPREVMGPIVNSDFGETVAMLVAVSGGRYGYRELREYVDQLQDALRAVPEVGRLSTYGQQKEQIWVTSDLARMSQYFTDPLRVIGALAQRNVIQGAGSVATGAARVPLHTGGAFQAESEIGKVMVGQSPQGQPIYIEDFAKVERRYQDPDFLVRLDGHPTVMLSVEMQKGNNIVALGEHVAAALAQARPQLPPDLRLDFVANQPEVVKERLAGMGHEFLIAIACVVLVTMLLLPMRVALIAAMAIPVTMLTTLGVMNALGVQLHQVSIAALILVLGIVVDDAIVIADNYVELLDHGLPPGGAAVSAATEVLVPVLTATLTIIASFLPLVLLSGSAGEFILALPITVTTALTVSFGVAVLLTPLLCRTFIRKGLHDPAAAPAEGARRVSFLDFLQAAYTKAIHHFMAHRTLAVGLGLGALAAGLLLFRFVPRQFFPNAERNQFVIDLWLPQGSRIEATDQALRRLEAKLAEQREVVHVATFVGQSAPRFYYNVNPQQPDPAYGQMILNTRDAKATGPLVAELQASLARVAPEGLVIVKELQQGSVLEAPIEVRVSGGDLAQLKVLGRRIEDLLRADPQVRYVHTDHFNDSALADVTFNTELASRLGMTNAEVSRLLSGAFDGLPIGTFWEGDRPVTILLRGDPAHRASFDDVRDTYLSSSIAQGRVPLRAIADLTPAWQPSRRVRRNGVPTLTVRGFPAHGTYASEPLRRLLPALKALPLPPGIRVTLGGERENQDETFPEMAGAMGIGLLGIFLILMLQFRNLVEPLVVMTSIPLSLFGVVMGLLLTRNPFGFTAFMGMIALSGIVVRNAIILIDFIKEKQREGLSLEAAATQAGQRRLRPIFLTTMAAAVGVTPMILSGSRLWSPLASVLAVGLVFSMFFTLLVVPVLYVLVFSPRPLRPAGKGLALLLLLAGARLGAAEAETFTLDQAVSAALRNNTAVRIAQAKVRERESVGRAVRSDYGPHLTADASWLKGTSDALVKLPAGALGSVPGLGPFPLQPVEVGQGTRHVLLENLTLAQPLTQLYKVRQGSEVASADAEVAREELRKLESDLAFKTRQVYVGILIAEARLEAARAAVVAAESQAAEAREAVAAGNALPVVAAGSRAALLQARHQQLTAESALPDLTAELDDLLGLPVDTPLKLAPVPPMAAPLPAREALLSLILGQNPELAAAQATLEKGRSALRAGRSDYLPDLSVFTRWTYQDGMPFLLNHYTTFGLNLTWTLYDGGRREAVLSQRAAQVSQASEDLSRNRARLELDLGRLLRKVEAATLLVEVAEEAASLSQEKARLGANQRKAGLLSAAKEAEASAAAKTGAADLLAARLGLVLARAEVDHLLGLP